MKRHRWVGASGTQWTAESVPPKLVQDGSVPLEIVGPEVIEEILRLAEVVEIVRGEVRWLDKKVRELTAAGAQAAGEAAETLEAKDKEIALLRDANADLIDAQIENSPGATEERVLRWLAKEDARELEERIETLEKRSGAVVLGIARLDRWLEKMETDVGADVGRLQRRLEKLERRKEESERTGPRRRVW